MKITLIDAGKRFNRDWIFRHLNYEFTPAHRYAIIGPNGSGKSTLLQLIAGAIGISEGSLTWQTLTSTVPTPSTIIPTEALYRHLSLASPYLELIEEMTVTEFLRFHSSFKPLLPGSSIPDIIRQVGLQSAADKQMRYYSSGMKQRVRLAQALFSDTPVVLLDEPTTNLDEEGIALYRQLIRLYGNNRMLIISSNDRHEYDFCEKIINIMEYK